MKKKNGRGLLGYAEKLLEEKFGKVKNRINLMMLYLQIQAIET